MDRVMYAVGILAPFVTLPQVIQVWIFRDSSGVSAITWLLMGIVALLWCVYGFIHKEKPLIISNALFCIFNFLIILGVFLDG